MGAHLRPLLRCQFSEACSRAATEELYNAVNARCGVYCSLHAKAALARFTDDNDDDEF